jgi:cbb3-type cytochrome c oxidase subunit III
MRSVLKLGVVLAFLIAGAFTFPARETQTTSLWASAASSNGLASPRTLFIQNCARCHGANGKAQTPLGLKLEADDLTTSTASTAKIIRTVTNGRGDMPSFRRKLSKAQIASLAVYVKSL